MRQSQSVFAHAIYLSSQLGIVFQEQQTQQVGLRTTTIFYYDHYCKMVAKALVRKCKRSQRVLIVVYLLSQLYIHSS